MVTLVEPTNVHKIEFNATTTAGPSRVTSVTGTMPISLAALVQAKNPQCLVEMPLPLVAEAACDRFAGASCLEAAAPHKHCWWHHHHHHCHT